jgi:phosphate transport system substrate-binding protein
MEDQMARHLRKQLLFFVVFLCLLTAIACNSNSSSLSNAQPANTDSSGIVAAGSTYIYPVMTRWIRDFQKNHPGAQINYQSIGSGGGIQQLKKGLVDIGASDAALDDQQLKDMPALVQIPESAGPVCITYNLPELKQPLKLSANTLAAIFLGRVKKWQDPAIKQDNPGAVLPNHDIVVTHRVGKGISVNWPAGLGGKGSDGATEVVKQTPGGIGYVELTYAKENNLPVALVRNRAGNWAEPTAAGTTAAINAFAEELAKDVRVPIVDPPASAKDAYPIVGLTFLLVPKQGKNAKKTIKDFIGYIVTQGQEEAVSLSYAKLPDALEQQDRNLLAQVGSGGGAGGTEGRAQQAMTCGRSFPTCSTGFPR